MADTTDRKLLHKIDKRLAVIEERTRSIPEMQRHIMALYVRNAGTAAAVALLVSAIGIIVSKLVGF